MEKEGASVFYSEKLNPAMATLLYHEWGHALGYGKMKNKQQINKVTPAFKYSHWEGNQFFNTITFHEGIIFTLQALYMDV